MGGLSKREAFRWFLGGMKDGTSAALDTVDSGGGSTSEGGGGGSTRSNSPDSSGMNTVSPPGTISPEAAALVSAAAVCNSYRQCSDEPVGPILNQATFSDMLNLRANILAPFLPLSLPGALTSGSSIFPHHHSIYSWAPTASSPSSIQMERTNSKHNNNNRMALRTTSSKKNNNNVVTSSSAAVTRKNQANTKKRGPRKTDPTEAAIIEVTAMTHITDPEPLSPPTSGSSPPTDIVNSGQGTNVVVEKDAVAGREKVFTCRTCNRSFGYKHVLQNHERTHTGEKPFRCQVCDKRFTRDHHLKTHMRLHTGEKPYLCTHCDRQFVQVANLRRHLRVHTGERPYACTVCSAKFSDSNQLKAHMLIHKGVKPFGCDKCQNRFRRRHHLMHHKCSGKADSSTDIHKAERKSPESIIDTTANIMQSYCQNIRQYAQMRSDVDFRSSQEENSSVITRASRLMMRPMSELMADVERGIKMDDIENEDDALGMVVEEEEEGVDEHDLTSPDRNCLILSHNNNGSVLERKCRGRKPQEIRRVIRMPNSPSPSITSTQAPMIMSSPLTLPTAAHLPEQTEPEDLSMSTGHQHGYRNNNVHSNSHSSGDSPLSRSPSSGLEEEEEELDTNLPPSSLFLQHRHPKFRRHHEHIQRNNGAAPVS